MTWSIYIYADSKSNEHTRIIFESPSSHYENVAWLAPYHYISCNREGSTTRSQLLIISHWPSTRILLFHQTGCLAIVSRGPMLPALLITLVFPQRTCSMLSSPLLGLLPGTQALPLTSSMKKLFTQKVVLFVDGGHCFASNSKVCAVTDTLSCATDISCILRPFAYTVFRRTPWTTHSTC